MERARRGVAGGCPIRWPALFLAFSFAILPAGIAAPADPNNSTELRETLRRALLQAQQADVRADALTNLRTVIDAPAFQSLSTAEQHFALSAAAQAALRAGEAAVALDLSRRATTDSQPDIDAWRTRLLAASRLREGADEVASILAIARGWGRAALDENEYTILQAARDARNQHLEEQRFAMLQWLYEQRWHLRDGDEPSQLWRDLSLHLLESGHIDQAREVAGHVTAPYQLVAMRADSRFGKLVKFASFAGNAPKAADEHIDKLKTQVQEQPRSLERIVWLARALLVRLRDDEVMRLTDEPLRMIESEGGESSHFTDTAEQAAWIYDVRARALRDLGRDPEALELLRRAAAWKDSKDKVSHGINLAFFLCELSQPQEALRSLPDPSGASDYGRLMIAQVQLLAAVQLNDAAGIERAIVDARKYGAESPQVVLRLLVVAGKYDEAIASLKDQLHDEAQRAETLVDLQDYLDTRAPSMVRDWRSHLKALRDRPDVRSVIASAGSIRNYPLRPNGI